MSDSQFEYVGFNGANLEEARLNRARMLTPRMRTSNLHSADLRDALFEHPILRGWTTHL